MGFPSWGLAFLSLSKGVQTSKRWANCCFADKPIFSLQMNGSIFANQIGNSPE